MIAGICPESKVDTAYSTELDEIRDVALSAGKAGTPRPRFITSRGRQVRLASNTERAQTWNFFYKQGLAQAQATHAQAQSELEDLLVEQSEEVVEERGSGRVAPVLTRIEHHELFEVSLDGRHIGAIGFGYCDHLWYPSSGGRELEPTATKDAAIALLVGAAA